MSRLLEASERLKAAINSLEAVVESRLVQESGNQSAASDEVDALRGQLAALRQDYDKLASTTQTVSARLDGAVGQLRLVLEDDREQKQA
tara:strand:- start:2201 stop:2467 length:267 start_codon:yes stop_codon:yes gene_type:complete